MKFKSRHEDVLNVTELELHKMYFSVKFVMMCVVCGLSHSIHPSGAFLRSKITISRWTLPKWHCHTVQPREDKIQLICNLMKKQDSVSNEFQGSFIGQKNYVLKLLKPTYPYGKGIYKSYKVCICLV